MSNLGMRFGIAIAPGAGLLLGGTLGWALTIGLGFWQGVGAILGGVVGLVLGAYWAHNAQEQVEGRRE